MKPITSLAAEIDYHDTELGVFNPLIAMSRLKHAFPNVEQFGGDHLEDTCVNIIDIAKTEGSGAVRIALRDFIERGPALRFRIPRSDGSFYTGIADRQRVKISSDEPFSDEFREAFEMFLNTLTLPRVVVTSA